MNKQSLLKTLAESKNTNSAELGNILRKILKPIEAHIEKGRSVEKFMKEKVITLYPDESKRKFNRLYLLNVIIADITTALQKGDTVFDLKTEIMQDVITNNNRYGKAFQRRFQSIRDIEWLEQHISAINVGKL